MSYIDDLLGKDFEKKRLELERKLKRYSPDYNIIADAISKEIHAQLERKLKGLEFQRITENSKQDQSTFEANCIFKNCERRIFDALKKVNKNTNIETNEIAENTSSELKNGDYDKTILIDDEALFNEFRRRGIIHRRGKITQKEIEIWYFKLYGNYTYDDIQNEYGLTYDMAKQAVSKVKWAVEELKRLKANEGTSGMYFLTNEESDSVKVMNVLHFLEKKEAQNTNSNKLVAYRFSPEELLKMLELKKILQNEDKNDAKKPNLKFEFDRFPEVYFKNKLEELNESLINELQTKNFDEENFGEKNSDEEESKIRYVKFIKTDLPNNIKDKIANHETLTEDEKKDLFDLDKYVNSESFNINRLGVYRSSKTKLGCLNVTNEGKIILYKDVIEAYVKNHDNIDEKDVRLIVLMHELGHWVSHWPIANNATWRIGYNTGHKKTQEAIAQIIAYWMIKGDEDLEKAFELMNPTKKNSPYRLYENLISQHISEILNKIVDLRKHHYLNDSAQYRYLADSSLNYIDNPMLMHLKTCLIFNDSLEAISDCTLDPETIQLIQDEIKKELKEGVKKEDLESLKECLSDLKNLEKITQNNEALIFTWEYKNVGPNRMELFRKTLTPAVFLPSDEFNEMQVEKYKDTMKNLGFFSAFEKYVDEKTGEITLYKLMVPNPNPEEGENPKYAIWIYKGDSISKLEITPSEIITNFKSQAPLTYAYPDIERDAIDLSADLWNLGFGIR